MVMDRPCEIVLLTPVEPRESPTYYSIFHVENTLNTRERPTKIKLVELSITNHIVHLIHKHHILNGV